MNDRFLARRVLELTEENERLQDRVKWLTWTLAQVSAGPVHEVSADQFSLLVHEGVQQ